MLRNVKLYIIAILTFLLTSCHSSPSLDILGSYFPSWMLCTLIGITLTVIAHIIFIKIDIDKFIPMTLLTYILLAISLTFITWLIWFGN